MVPIFEIEKCLLKDVFREILFLDLFLSLFLLIGDLRLLLFMLLKSILAVVNGVLLFVSSVVF